MAANPWLQDSLTPPSYPSEPPGARFYDQIVQIDNVRLLLPLGRVVIHIMDQNLVKGLPCGTFQTWMFFTGLTFRDFFASFGIRVGVREHHEIGEKTFKPSQKILVDDSRAGKSLAENGWIPGRGYGSKPVWLEVLEK
ncbi:MAG: hypothetical protein Q9182_001868 [Xanthomendoza sp. 2 TL-2023]